MAARRRPLTVQLHRAEGLVAQLQLREHHGVGSEVGAQHPVLQHAQGWESGAVGGGPASQPRAPRPRTRPCPPVPQPGLPAVGGRRHPGGTGVTGHAPLVLSPRGRVPAPGTLQGGLGSPPGMAGTVKHQTSDNPGPCTSWGHPFPTSTSPSCNGPEGPGLLARPGRDTDPVPTLPRLILRRRGPYTGSRTPIQSPVSAAPSR